MARLTLLALLSALALRCGGDDRDVTLRSTFARADDALARSRPALLAGRYALMASSPVSFYRGALALFLRDWRDGAMELSRSRFALDDPMPLGVGDPHVENFGTLQGPDGRLTLEPNDLDGADRVPYLWDLRRLTVEAGYSLTRSLLDADGTYGDPFFARYQDWRVYLSASVVLDRLFDGRPHPERGIVRW